jgi:hypothetical protein
VKSSAAFWEACSAVTAGVEKTECATNSNACKISHSERGKHNASNRGNSFGHHDSGLHPYHYKSEGIATRISTSDFDATSDFDGAFTFTRATAYPAGIQSYWLFAQLQGRLYRRL